MKKLIGLIACVLLMGAFQQSFADTKITGLTELSAAPAAADLFEVVDVSDDTMAGTGTNKQITTTNLFGFLNGYAGTVTGKVKVLPAGSSCTIGSDCDSTSVAVAYGGTILATAAITITLPEIVASPDATQVGVGATICIIARDASEELTIDVNANDSITLDGTKDTAGDSIDATGAGAFACLMAVEEDNWMVLGKSGTWAAN